MKFTKVLKDKKGAALEMAIFFMIIVFCFCTLLTTMTLTARSRIKLEKIYFELDLDNDPIAEEIAADCLRYLDFLVLTSMYDENHQVIFPSPIFTATLNDQTDSNYAFNYNSPKNYLSFVANGQPLPDRYADYTRVDDNDPDNPKTVLIQPVSHVDYVGDDKMRCTITLHNSSAEPVTVVVEYTLNEDGTALTKEIIQDK